MVGSGTTLVEACLMNRHSVGYDIDPLARLIAEVKSRKVKDAYVEQAHEEISSRAAKDYVKLQSSRTPAAVRERATPPDFSNRDYWFSPDVSAVLAVLSYHIAQAPMPESARKFLWVAFSSLILAKTSVANARDIIHSRHHYWHHSQPSSVLDKFDARVRLMRKQMAEFSKRCEKASNTKAEARLGDARRLRIKDETVDLVFTSPPYATALDYSRAHFLAVAWMQKALGISLQDYREKAPIYIGSERGHLGKHLEMDERLANLNRAQSVITLRRIALPCQADTTLLRRYAPSFW